VRLSLNPKMLRPGELEEACVAARRRGRPEGEIGPYRKFLGTVLIYLGTVLDGVLVVVTILPCRSRLPGQ